MGSKAADDFAAALDNPGKKKPPGLPRIKRVKKAGSEELRLQMATFRKYRAVFIEDCEAIHVPNGGRRLKKEAKLLRDCGVRKGAADWVVCLPNGGRYAAIELKDDNGRLSKDQEEYRDKILRLGGRWALARTVEQFAEILGTWIKEAKGV